MNAKIIETSVVDRGMGGRSLALRLRSVDRMLSNAGKSCSCGNFEASKSYTLLFGIVGFAAIRSLKKKGRVDNCFNS